MIKTKTVKFCLYHKKYFHIQFQSFFSKHELEIQSETKTNENVDHISHCLAAHSPCMRDWWITFHQCQTVVRLSGTSSWANREKPKPSCERASHWAAATAVLGDSRGSQTYDKQRFRNEGGETAETTTRLLLDWYKLSVIVIRYRYPYLWIGLVINYSPDSVQSIFGKTVKPWFRTFLSVSGKTVKQNTSAC